MKLGGYWGMGIKSLNTQINKKVNDNLMLSIGNKMLTLKNGD